MKAQANEEEPWPADAGAAEERWSRRCAAPNDVRGARGGAPAGPSRSNLEEAANLGRVHAELDALVGAWAAQPGAGR